MESNYRDGPTGHKNLLIKESCVCRRLRPDENPTVNVPNITTLVPKRKEPAQRCNVVVSAKCKVARAVQTESSCLLTDSQKDIKDTAVQTEFDMSYSEL